MSFQNITNRYTHKYILKEHVPPGATCEIHNSYYITVWQPPIQAATWRVCAKPCEFPCKYHEIFPNKNILPEVWDICIKMRVFHFTLIASYTDTSGWTKIFFCLSTHTQIRATISELVARRNGKYDGGIGGLKVFVFNFLPDVNWQFTSKYCKSSTMWYRSTFFVIGSKICESQDIG